jgi:hypothetical protein
MTRILVTGSRNWTDPDVITRILDFALQHQTTLSILVGDCPTGVDRITFDWAAVNEVPVTRYEAHWLEEGRAAGPLRNQRMVDARPHVCIAFPLGESRGTRDCVKRAEAAGIKVINYGDPEPEAADRG